MAAVKISKHEFIANALARIKLYQDPRPPKTEEQILADRDALLNTLQALDTQNSEYTLDNGKTWLSPGDNI